MDALKMSRSVLPHRRLLPLDERLEHAAARPVIIPETIVCDRGKAFISENFRSACRTLEISFRPCHPRSPAEKPHIERTLGSVATLFCQFLPGYLGRTAEHRGRRVEDEPLWSMLEIQEFLDEWLVATWQNRRHDGLRDPGSPGRTFTPNEKYASLIESAGYVPLAFAGDDYVELLPATWRAVDSYGVKINHRVHDCAELGPLRRRPSGVTRKKNLWEIHRDPYDANWIWVRNHWEGGRIPVPWKHLGTVPQPYGDPAWDHAAADLRQRGESDPTEEQIARAVSELLVRARQGPDSGGKNRASRRDRRVAARTRAAAEGTGPQPPKPGPVPTGTDAHGLATTRKGATRRTNRSRRSSRSVSSIPSRRLTNDGDRNGALAQPAAGPGTAAPMATGPGPRGTAPLPHHPGRLAGVRRPGSGPT
ncbi:transposase family protein [Streptomyces sp. NPDC002602]|uniref:transposase family protein n=1 Tax=Streptomyces sp. NPDC002602 TaxID=3364654 RepID=UPI0036C6C815